MVRLEIVKHRRSFVDWLMIGVWINEVFTDHSGYVDIIAIDHNGRREQVGQPMRPTEAERLVEVFSEQLQTTPEAEWFRQHHLRHLDPTPDQASPGG